MTDRPRVRCDWCGRVFDDGCSSTQAYGCAASSFQQHGMWFVLGHYGSFKYDLVLLRFTNSGFNQACQSICDDCVTTAIEQNELEIVSSDVPVEGPSDDLLLRTVTRYRLN